MKLYRQNGTPIDPTHFKERADAFNKRFDELKEIHGLPTGDKPEVMELYNKELSVLDVEFMDRYPLFEEITFPRNEKQYKALEEKYGGPICFCTEENKVVGYVMPVTQN